MPKIFEWNGYKFFFFSNEGVPLEPCHIHVRKNEKTAKFWVNSIEVKIESSFGFNSKEIKNIKEVIELHNDLIVEKWNEYFNL